jgi:competence protein ComEA
VPERDEVLDPPARPTPDRPLAQRAREWLVWFGVVRLIVVAGAVVAVGAGGYWLLRAPRVPVESSLPRATTTAVDATTTVPASPATPAASTSAAPSELVVHVAGHVVAPGVYTVRAGSRVVDAVAAAGGASGDAATDSINLAELLRDGDRVYVPGIDDAAVVPAGVTPAAPVSSGGATPSGPLDLNTATAEQLDALPGVGPSTAAAIVAYRAANGPFSSVDGLDQVRGIGPSKLAALRDLVTV